ncbi:MAG: FAD-dependent monooxygenase [Bacteroidetes bacterium]|nr:FAD-dependent monooxygenase [Bacteroidota bacterium]MBL0258936.1 FAD-dependent monooxygenase [Bacteroidota bacterium]
MASSSVKNITIIGAGMVGSLLSIYLARRGYKVSIFERRPDMRTENIPAGRSINLALSDRGWRGLEGVGIETEIRKIGIPMSGRIMHSISGDLTYQQYGEKDQAIYATSRGILNCEMMNLAEKNGVKIHFNERCAGIDLEHNTARFENTLTKISSSNSSDLIFGADGAFSAARLQLQLTTERFQYSQNYLEHAYKELMIPAGPGGEFQMEKHALHIWPRGGYMMIALPNLDGSFTVTLFFPFEGKDSFATINNPSECLQFFNRVFPDAVKIMPTLTEDFFQNPTGGLVTVKCFPWTYKDKMALIGDSAHAITPFYGQGMNCGFEDCTVLNSLIDQFDGDWNKILPEYQQARKPNSDAIADLAVMNFIEMRDLVGSPQFLLQKKIEARVHDKYPQKWLPLYSQVTFSSIPYADALANGRRQQSIMQEVMAMPDIDKRWDSSEVENFILQKIS